MSYLGENRIEIDFAPNITSSNNYNILENQITFYNNDVMDLSAFTGIFGKKHETNLQHNFYASKFDGFTFYTNV